MNRKELLKRVRRVVVKIGTAALSNEEGRLDEARVERVSAQIHALRQRGLKAAVVSSGAIGAGMSELGIRRRPTRLPELQACAAVGQGRLTAAYDRYFRRRGYHAAQVLLTRQDFDDRHRYLNASNAIHAILAYGAVPLINENDTVSVEEIPLTFGDNDILAALVTNLLCAEALILLTVVDGLYENPKAPLHERRLLRVVPKVTEEVRRVAEAGRSRGGTGGMASKVEAARMATSAGGIVIVANAGEPRVLERIFDGEEIGTLFLPAKERMTSRKRWLRFGSRPKGALLVDDGARRALVERGKSLLPSGIVHVRGDFSRGDLVAICNEHGSEFGRGLVNYGTDEMQKIMGQKTSALRRILGDAPYEEAIHRDHLVMHD